MKVTPSWGIKVIEPHRIGFMILSIHKVEKETGLGYGAPMQWIILKVDQPKNL